MMNNRHYGPSRNSSRRGAAPIELVFCLPFLVGALAVIFTLSSAGLAKSQSVISARHNAWRERNTTWQDSPTVSQHATETGSADALGMILSVEPGYGPRDGLLEGYDKRNVAVAHPGYESQNLTTDTSHFVLAGAWDFRRIPSTDRGRLVPSTNFTALALDGMPNMSGFTDILNADVLSNVGSLLDGSDILNQLTQGKAEAVKKIAELEQKIKELKQQIEDIKNSDSPDLQQILELEKQIADLYKQISDIQDAMGQLDDFGNQLPL